MLPAQGRQELQQAGIGELARLAQGLRCPLQIDRIPQHDGGCHQVQAAGAVPLLLECPVADFAQPMNEDRPGQRVARLPFVQTGVHAAAQLDVLEPVQDEQRAFDPAQLAQRDRQAILPRVAAELAQHEGGRDGAMLDRGGQAQHVVPMSAQVLDVQTAADHGAERRVVRYLAGHVQLGVAQVADAWREAEPEQVHQREHVVREPGGVSVVLLNAQIRFMVQQAVQHIG